MKCRFKQTNIFQDTLVKKKKNYAQKYIEIGILQLMLLCFEDWQNLSTASFACIPDIF